VCTLIEESEALRAESAINTHHYLQQNLPNQSVVLIHGKMKKDEIITIRQQFACGEFNVMVATTVIELCVNVTNSSLMVIENSERLGFHLVTALTSDDWTTNLH
jgi:ATP-dependent DNA helicase RecG